MFHVKQDYANGKFKRKYAIRVYLNRIISPAKVILNGVMFNDVL